jgi:hypothetical protein
METAGSVRTDDLDRPRRGRRAGSERQAAEAAGPVGPAQLVRQLISQGAHGVGRRVAAEEPAQAFQGLAELAISYVAAFGSVIWK